MKQFTTTSAAVALASGLKLTNEKCWDKLEGVLLSRGKRKSSPGDLRSDDVIAKTETDMQNFELPLDMTSIEC